MPLLMKILYLPVQRKLLYRFFLAGQLEGTAVDGAEVVEVDIGDIHDISGLVFI